jgi:hypothetical protein
MIKNVSKNTQPVFLRHDFQKLHTRDGEFAIKVGIPAKSGVSGGIMGISPYNFGIGIFGPALYMPHVTINVLQILATSFLMTCSPVSGCLPSRA